MSSPKSAAGNSLEALRPSASTHRKAPADFYTVLLSIALVALLLAILFLWLYVKVYNYQMKTPMMPTAAAWTGPAASGSREYHERSDSARSLPPPVRRLRAAALVAGESPFEMIVGAVLTQNTSWQNVERAIENLRRGRPAGAARPVRRAARRNWKS